MSCSATISGKFDVQWHWQSKLIGNDVQHWFTELQERSLGCDLESKEEKHRTRRRGRVEKEGRSKTTDIIEI